MIYGKVHNLYGEHGKSCSGQKLGSMIIPLKEITVNNSSTVVRCETKDLC